MPSGELSILNVGEGDTRLSFDPDKPLERERAARIVQDMLQRGYAIMVQVGEQEGEPIYRRAKSFDPKTCEYLVMGLSEEEEREIADKLSGKKRRSLNKRVPAATATAIATPRSARGCARAAW